MTAAASTHYIKRCFRLAFLFATCCTTSGDDRPTSTIRLPKTCCCDVPSCLYTHATPSASASLTRKSVHHRIGTSALDILFGSRLAVSTFRFHPSIPSQLHISCRPVSFVSRPTLLQILIHCYPCHILLQIFAVVRQPFGCATNCFTSTLSTPIASDFYPACAH